MKIKDKKWFWVTLIIIIITPIISVILFKEALFLFSIQNKGPEIYGQFLAIFVFAGLAGALCIFNIVKMFEGDIIQLTNGG